MNRQMHNAKGGGEWRPLVTGLLFALGTAIALLLIFSFLLTIKDFGNAVQKAMTLISLAAASFIGGFSCSKRIGSKGLQAGAWIGGIIFLVITVAGIIMNGLNFSIITLIKGILCILLGMIGGIFGVNIKAKRKMK